MFRISKKGDYAVFLMCALARRAPHGDPDVVSAQEIADRSGLPKSVVANLLKDLTRAGFLDSVRGIHGGYRMARPAEDISLGQILETVEGPFQLVECVDDDAGAAAAKDDGSCCTLLSFCPSRGPMQALHERIAKLMDEIRLPELIEQSGGACESLRLSLTASHPSPRP